MADKFWSLVDRESDGCWLWVGKSNAGGYGRFVVNGERAYVHRIAFEDAHGPIPAGMVIDHKCHQKLCVRPSHLQAVTVSANAQNRAGAASNSRSGVRGVHRLPGGKWRVQFRVNGRTVHGGVYVHLAEATAAASSMRAEHMQNSLADKTAEPTR